MFKVVQTDKAPMPYWGKLVLAESGAFVQWIPEPVREKDFLPGNRDDKVIGRQRVEDVNSSKAVRNFPLKKAEAVPEKSVLEKQCRWVQAHLDKLGDDLREKAKSLVDYYEYQGRMTVNQYRLLLVCGGKIKKGLAV